MDFAGLLAKFKVNRPLTDRERSQQLNQKSQLDVAPHYQLSVIKMNSTYLESVDKWYDAKGTITAVTSIIIVMFIYFYIDFVYIVSNRVPSVNQNNNDRLILIVAGFLMFPVVVFALWVFLKESFSFTHYPMRFNRKTRVVHVFRPDGTVLSVPWDEIFFTLGQVDEIYKSWNVLGHILSEDNTVVLESFALSVSETGQYDGIVLLNSHWEFIRRYMEEGPESLTGQIRFCLPIDEQKESLNFALHRVLANASTGSVILPFNIIPMAIQVMILPFRVLAMLTSKIPSWPNDIEESCVVEIDDPYAIRGAANGDRIPVFPASAEKAGVGFTAPPVNPIRFHKQKSK